MWEKFGQLPNKTRVKEIDNPVDLNKFHESHWFGIQYVSVLTKERVEIQYKHQTEDDPVFTILWIISLVFRFRVSEGGAGSESPRVFFLFCFDLL